MPLDDHLGDLAAIGVYAEPVELPDVAVGGMDVIAAALFHLIFWNEVDFLHLADRPDLVPVHDFFARASPAQGGRKQLYGDVLRQGLFGGAQVLELRLGVAKLDLILRGVDVVQRNEPGQPVPRPVLKFRLDHEMGYRPGSRVHDQGLELTGKPIAAVSGRTDDQTYLRHSYFLLLEP
jgi:hypothetical protein